MDRLMTERKEKKKRKKDLKFALQLSSRTRELIESGKITLD